MSAPWFKVRKNRSNDFAARRGDATFSGYHSGPQRRRVIKVVSKNKSKNLIGSAFGSRSDRLDVSGARSFCSNSAREVFRVHPARQADRGKTRIDNRVSGRQGCAEGCSEARMSRPRAITFQEVSGVACTHREASMYSGYPTNGIKHTSERRRYSTISDYL